MIELMVAPMFGDDAFKAGFDFSENPHEQYTSAHVAWRNDWLVAKKEAAHQARIDA